MDNAGLAERLVDALERPDGDLSKRPVHTFGVGATGYFEASPVAPDFCTAQHFQGRRIPVQARFSNGSGSATERDGWSDVRGLAVRFQLPDETATDLVAMTLPEFFTPTPEDFEEFARRAAPRTMKRESPWRKILDMLRLTPPMRNPYPGETISPDAGAMEYADDHPHAQLAVFQAAQIGVPVSYARAAYHAVHTFVVTATDGTKRYVRFSWQPIAGVLVWDPTKDPLDKYLSKDLLDRLKDPVNKYLKEELRDRLKNGPAVFSLMMSIGETGDDFNDSSRPWPPHRVRVMMGTLTLTELPFDQQLYCEDLSFNPWLLTDGIAPSDDPVLLARRDAYKLSSERRRGTPCPFSGAE